MWAPCIAVRTDGCSRSLLADGAVRAARHPPDAPLVQGCVQRPRETPRTPVARPDEPDELPARGGTVLGQRCGDRRDLAVQRTIRARRPHRVQTPGPGGGQRLAGAGSEPSPAGGLTGLSPASALTHSLVELGPLSRALVRV